MIDRHKSVWGKGRDRAKNAGEVKELFKLRMLLAQEQMDMAINNLWLEIQKWFLLIQRSRFQNSLPEGELWRENY